MSTNILVISPGMGNECIWEFRWGGFWSVPQADATYFPAILSGRIDPTEMAQRIVQLNEFMAKTLRPLRYRLIVPIIAFPVSSLFFLLYAISFTNRSSTGGGPNFSYLAIAIGFMVGAIVAISVFRCRMRAIFDTTTVGMRNLIAAIGQAYTPRGLFWSLQVVDTVQAVTRRGRLIQRPTFYLKIEVLPSGTAVIMPGSNVPVTMGGALPPQQMGAQYPSYQGVPMPMPAAQPYGAPGAQPMYTPPAGGYQPVPTAAPTGAQGYYPGPPRATAANGYAPFPQHPAPAGNYAPMPQAAPTSFAPQGMPAQMGAGGGGYGRVGGSAPPGDDGDPTPFVPSKGPGL